ncbi:Rab3 GTPase-activating protein catalytic subunit [Caenorhabditis elegans]|uniref:Rab3 GTPase-activating protein catalytic subunit n=1 Tax=Caenorhabditis elegans TaxID=6239 RepID=Q7YX69_CAEEL|nr:Rab3 GTPase-activating protein catalytic subunit [Caenorhabditis elegans]CAE17726.2 Rab3 GTPase-activating protein catalytic subunit [Caenorhabditis elegans]|eukprot:NP_001021176.2 Uncharacterized protein CELE_C16C10.13 [Caenorhabditis elegans]
MNPLAEVKTNATEIKFLNYLEDKKKYEPDWTIRELEDKISLSELVKTCLEHHSFLDLPDLFPRFLCGLLAVYREQNTTSLPYTGSIFSRSSNAVKFLNDPENYPCHSMNMTDVVALVPGRIYSGCVKDTDPEKFSQFDSVFIMSHPFPDVQKCQQPVSVMPKCELRSMLVQHKILYQQKDCCCDSNMCAVLIFTQTSSLTPLVLKTIDLTRETMVPFPVTTTEISLNSMFQ